MHPWEVKNPRFSKICPSIAKYFFDAFSAQGRLNLVSGLINGELTLADSPRILEIIFACTLCGACDTMCKRSMDHEVLLTLKALRTKAVDVGIGPLPEHKAFTVSIEKHHNPYNEPHEDRLKWLGKAKPKLVMEVQGK
jgi:Fe-S oxidoreductase